MFRGVLKPHCPRCCFDGFNLVGGGFIFEPFTEAADFWVGLRAVGGRRFVFENLLRWLFGAVVQRDH